MVSRTADVWLTSESSSPRPFAEREADDEERDAGEDERDVRAPAHRGSSQSVRSPRATVETSAPGTGDR